MKIKILFLFLILLLAASVSGCSKAGKNGEITVFNYGDYMDPDVVGMFEKETGIKVNYEEYQSPESMYTKYSSGAINYDVICTSDYMVEKLIQEGKLETIDMDAIENTKNIGSKYWELSKAFDPDNTYSIPYFWGTVGILYNKTMVSEKIDSWSSLWDEKYADNIIMQNSIRDTFLVPLKSLGYSINTTDQSQLKEAQTLLIKQKPLVQAYLLDEIREEMISENAAISLAYSGDAYYAQGYNDNLEYVIPKEGSDLWIDSWMIPKDCENKEGAEAFLNYLCRDDIALKNFEYICYSSPIDSVYDDAEKSVKESNALFPKDSDLENCEVYTSLDNDTMSYMSDLWKEIKAD